MSAARIVVHVVPRARTTELAGTHGDAIRIRVAAPPADGAANAALLRFLADQLGVPVARVRITAGATGRRKVIEVDGVSEERVRRALMADG
jgi:uncharacterized protein (TIGR00251 family)